MPRGKRVEIPAPGTNRKIPLYGALNYRTNRVSYHIGSRKNTTEFLAFLAQLAQEYKGRPCILVLDNASYHTAKAAKQYLAEMASNFEVIWLPYSPELNDIERIWKFVKGASLANYEFGTAHNLQRAIHETFQELNREHNSDLNLQYRDPLSKNLLKVA